MLLCLRPLRQVSYISAGLAHSLVVTKSGRCFAFGWGEFGQLGLGSCEDAWFPTQVADLSSVKVSVAAAGAQHSVFLATDGTVFTCGKATRGRLGHGDKARRVTPQPLSHLLPCEVVLEGATSSASASASASAASASVVSGAAPQWSERPPLVPTHVGPHHQVQVARQLPQQQQQLRRSNESPLKVESLSGASSPAPSGLVSATASVVRGDITTSSQPVFGLPQRSEVITGSATGDGTSRALYRFLSSHASTTTEPVGRR